MAEERVVNVAIMTYTADDESENGIPGSVAFRGDTIQVHAKGVKRFDQLNDVGGPGPREAFAASVAANSPAGPSPTQTGITHTEEDEDARAERDAAEPELAEVEEEDEELDEPSASAPKADWVAYAEQEGVDVDHEDGTAKTKAELIAELTGD